MLTLEQTLADQLDIKALCQPRNLNRFEFFGANDNYGFAYVIKKYAGYPIDKPIMATIPHGIYLRDRVIPTSELEAPFKAHFNYPPFTTPLWKKVSKSKQIIPFSSPIHYALKQFTSEVDKKNRNGTLFLPSHSTRVASTQFNKEAVIAELNDLPKKFHPITVCIHWNDITLGLHEYFENKGFKVVSAGHITDCNYLFRWLHLISQYKLVVGCGLGSAMFYSVLAGTPFYLTQEDAISVFDEKFQPFNKVGAQYSANAKARINKLRDVFGTLQPELTKQQIELANYYTYGNLIKSPTGLLKSLNNLAAL